ncbi:MAG TPA: MBL fold metallo-hydrolase [Candidatus Baltobacteraceae bacterium]|nr:MBL fold metallo-hydrolase [Candidatus Baltobacteraceae bacterium]
MIVRVLGSAAGGGVPQWNCACRNCAAARAGKQPRRSQSAIAVSAGGGRWILVNCSPDIAAQVEYFAPLQPTTQRGTPIAGMLFTDANVDHIGGLSVLRQQGDHRFIIRSSQTVREIAQAQPAFAPFTQPPHAWLDVPLNAPCAPYDDGDPVGRDLRVRAFPVPGVTPGYDGRRTITGAAVAYEVSTVNGRTAVFAPVFSAFTPDLKDAIRRAAIAFLDGSFFDDDEMIRQGLSGKRARALGHLPVGGDDGTLANLETRSRVIFTHLNNSNPMLDADSSAAAAVKRAGAEIAYDGLEITLE